MHRALPREHYLHELWFNEKMLAMYRRNSAETSDDFCSIKALYPSLLYFEGIGYSFVRSVVEIRY